MRLVCIACVILAAVLGTLSYSQHRTTKEIKIGALRDNLDGTISIIPDHVAIRQLDKAKTSRNLLAAGSGVSAVTAIGCAVLLLRKKTE